MVPLSEKQLLHIPALFGQSQETGQLVYISFALESVSSLTQRTNFMHSLLEYFTIITGIEGLTGSYPEKFSLSQNYPNPFNPETHFTINVPQTKRLQIIIFDLLGREVKSITNKIYTPGEYEFTWNATGFASGLYLLEMVAGKTRLTRKILLLK